MIWLRANAVQQVKLVPMALLPFGHVMRESQR
jgi:hypothetical protein